MCDRESFAKMRDAIGELQKADAAQSEQIKTLFNTTSEMRATIQGAFSRMLWIFCVIALLAVLALVYGALGEEGFNAVSNSKAVRQSSRQGLQDYRGPGRSSGS